MRTRRLGTSDLVVSEVGFGTWTLVSDWWGRSDDPHEMIKAALDAGINFIDTAPVYGADGAGETILRDYLASRDDLERLVDSVADRGLGHECSSSTGRW